MVTTKGKATQVGSTQHVTLPDGTKLKVEYMAGCDPLTGDRVFVFGSAALDKALGCERPSLNASTEAWQAWQRRYTKAVERVVFPILMAGEQAWSFSSRRACRCGCSPGWFGTRKTGLVVYVEPVAERRTGSSEARGARAL